MKKFVSLILALLLFGSGYVFASEHSSGELVPCEAITAPEFPETYVKPQIELFSVGATLEEILCESWANLDTRIDVSALNITLDTCGNMYFDILHQNPLYYYVGNSVRPYVYSNDPTHVVLLEPLYKTTDKEEIETTLTAIEKATDEILISIDDGMTDFEKVMTVHNHMVFDYEYDYTLTMYDIRIMTTKTGVCQAYAMAFQHLMNELGIDCTYVASPIIEDENGNIIGGMNHGWNLVKVDGNWYHIDLTWDDASNQPYSWLRNTFALLSDYQIKNMPNEKDRHYDYDTNGIEANSTKYDNATWHSNRNAIVTVNDLYYQVEDNKILRSDGKVIYKNLDGGDSNWLISKNSYINGIYTGLAERNGLLYFNTDTEILSYNPENGKTNTILEGYGFSGIYIFENTLHYGICNTKGAFVEGGSIKLGNVRYGKPRHEKGKIVARVYKETNDPLCIYSYGSGVVDMETVEEKGITAVTFDEQDTQTIFYWNENMQPLKEKEVINN